MLRIKNLSRLTLQTSYFKTKIYSITKFYSSQNKNLRISSYQKDCDNYNQLDITYNKNAYYFNIVNYALMVKKIMFLNIYKDRNALKFIKVILEGTQSMLETESAIETSEIYARSLANIYSYSYKIIQGISEKNRTEISDLNFLEFCEKKIENDFEKFNDQEQAITLVILEKRKKYQIMSVIANSQINRFDEFQLKAQVIIFQAYVKTNLKWGVLFKNIIDTFVKKQVKLADLSDQDFSDVLFCQCKETFLDSEEYFKKKEILLNCLFSIIQNRINKLKYRDIAKILSCFTYIIKKYQIPKKLLESIEKRVILEQDCLQNREICNCLIFFYETKYDSQELFDSIYRNLLKNNSFYSIADIETILYCISDTESEYKKPLIDEILNYFYNNNQLLTQKIRGQNYEKIFMGISKNKMTDTQDQALYSKLLQVILESLKKNLKTNYNGFTTSNLGAICSYIHPLTKYSYGFDELKQEIYSEIFVNLIDIEKEQTRKINFSQKSLKEIIDTLCKYFDRIEESFVKKVFTNWVFKELEKALSDNTEKKKYNQHTIEELSVILYNLNRLYEIDKNEENFNKNSQNLAIQAQNFLLEYKKHVSVSQKYQVKKSNFETLERYFKNHSKNADFFESNFEVTN